MTAPHDLPSPYAGPPLTVVQVGNTKRPWCSEVHFGASLRLLGHRVVQLQEDEMDWSTLVARVEAEGAQVVMWTRTWPSEMHVVLPVLAELEARGIPTVAVHLDRWHGLDREHQVRDQPYFRCSLVVTPNDDPRWAEDGVNHLWLPPGVYGPECEPVPPNPRRWPFDVVFVGSHPYPHPEWAKYRSNLLSTFQRAFRGRFGILPRRGRPIRGRDLQELYATVPVILGDSCLAGESFVYHSDRVPEVIGRGGLLIHPDVKGLFDGETYQRGEHLLTYDLGDFAGAIDQAKWGLANRDEAMAIREAGRTHVREHHTYERRMGQVLGHVQATGLLDSGLRLSRQEPGMV